MILAVLLCPVNVETSQNRVERPSVIPRTPAMQPSSPWVKVEWSQARDVVCYSPQIQQASSAGSAARPSRLVMA